MAKDKSKIKTEEIRQEFAKKYKAEISELKSELKETKIENSKLKDKVRELEGLLSERDEWVSRMQEFVNMEPEQFQRILENENRRKELDDSFSNFRMLFGNIINSFSV